MTDSPHRRRPRTLPEGVRAAGRNLGWLLASRGVVAVLSLVYLGIATRSLGVADFGRFALITGAAQAIATIVGFQTWQIVVRYGVDHVNSGDEAALARLLRLCVLLDAGCAVVGSDTPPVQEFITHEETGLLAPFFDPKGICDTVLRVLEDKALSDRLRHAARGYAEARLSMQDYLKSYERLIERLTGLPIGEPESKPAPRRRAGARGAAR